MSWIAVGVILGMLLFDDHPWIAMTLVVLSFIVSM